MGRRRGRTCESGLLDSARGRELAESPPNRRWSYPLHKLFAATAGTENTGCLGGRWRIEPF